jgi:hypothetical protein
MAVDRKYERDIDLLLAEELSVNPGFGDWLKSRTRFADEAAAVTEVFVSKSDTLGESDLIALYARPDGSRFAIMIEDKIDAPLQPAQAERYRLRGAGEIKLGACDAFTVLLCAPRYYLENSTGAATFDGAVSFEDIADVLKADAGSARGLYRAAFLETAATRRVNNWVREIDGPTEAFWSAAYALASREFPILEMKPLKVTKGSTWITFRPMDMPTMPRHVYISMKGDRGQMDLTFNRVNALAFHGRVASLLDADMTIHQTGASAAIRLQAPGFLISDGVEAGMPKVREAFEACARLIRFYRSHRAVLDQACEDGGVPASGQDRE